MRWPHALATALVGGALVACGDDGGPGQPGTLVVSLTTPNTGDAGILLTLTGPGFENVAAAASNQRIYWRLRADNEARVLVLADLTSGPLLTVSVPDVRQAASYAGAVQDVTDQENRLRVGLDAYGISVTRDDRTP